MTRSCWTLVAAIAVLSPSRLVGQGGAMTNCDFHSNLMSSTETINGIEVSSGSGGIKVTCKSRNLTLVADSGHKFGESRVDLFGHVHYVESEKLDLHSDFLTYFQAEERVVVTGHVIATTPTGSTLIGPEATYLRIIPGRRQFEELTAPRNPTVTIISKGDTAKPVTMNAATIYMRGDSLVYGSRNVVVSRVDMISHSDSAFLDGRSGRETTRLMFNPSVEGLQGRKFKLIGEIIDAYSKDRKLDRVIARGRGHAVSQDLDIVADTIDLRITANALEHAIAWSKPGQATATSPSQSIVADSIDIDMPKQKVRVIYAVRRAFAQADADTVRFRTTEKDWLRGDLVTAWFDTTVTKDTSSTPPIKRIVAIHRSDSARAYYHMAANDTSFHTPSITYVRGRQIQLDFDNRKIAMVTVKDSVNGIVIEPSHDSTKVAGAKTKTKAVTNAASKAATKTTTKPPVTTPPKKPPATMQGPGH